MKTVVIGNQEIQIHDAGTKEDAILEALNLAFEEIKNLKDQNRKLNDKINSLVKR